MMNCYKRMITTVFILVFCVGLISAGPSAGHITVEFFTPDTSNPATQTGHPALDSSLGADWVFTENTQLRFKVSVTQGGVKATDKLIFEASDYQYQLVADPIFINSATEFDLTTLNNTTTPTQVTVGDLFSELPIQTNKLWYMGIHADGFVVHATLNGEPVGLNSGFDPYVFKFFYRSENMTGLSTPAELVDNGDQMDPWVNNQRRQFSGTDTSWPHLDETLGGKVLHGGLDGYDYELRDTARGIGSNTIYSRKWVLYHYNDLTPVASWVDDETTVIARDHQPGGRTANQYILQCVTYDGYGMPGTPSLTTTTNLGDDCFVFEIGADPSQDPSNNSWIKYEAGGSVVIPPSTNVVHFPIGSNARFYVMPSGIEAIATSQPYFRVRMSNIFNFNRNDLIDKVDTPFDFCWDTGNPNCFAQFDDNEFDEPANYPVDVQWKVLTPYGYTQFSAPKKIYHDGSTALYADFDLTWYNASTGSYDPPTTLEPGAQLELLSDANFIGDYNRYISFWLVGDNGAHVRLQGQNSCYGDATLAETFTVNLPMDLSPFEGASEINIRGKIEYIETNEPQFSCVSPGPTFVSSFSSIPDDITRFNDDTTPYIQEQRFDFSSQRIGQGDHDLIEADGSVNFEFTEEYSGTFAPVNLRWRVRTASTPIKYWNGTWSSMDPGFQPMARPGEPSGTSFASKWTWQRFTSHGSITPNVNPFAGDITDFFQPHGQYLDQVDVVFETRLELVNGQWVSGRDLRKTLVDASSVLPPEIESFLINGSVNQVTVPQNDPLNYTLVVDTDAAEDIRGQMEFEMVHTSLPNQTLSCGAVGAYFSVTADNSSGSYTYNLTMSDTLKDWMREEAGTYVFRMTLDGECSSSPHIVSFQLQSVSGNSYVDRVRILIGSDELTSMVGVVDLLPSFKIRVYSNTPNNVLTSLKTQLNDLGCVGYSSYVNLVQTLADPSGNLVYDFDPKTPLLEAINVAGVFNLGFTTETDCTSKEFVTFDISEQQEAAFRIRFHYPDHLGSSVLSQVFSAGEVGDYSFDLGGLTLEPQTAETYYYSPFGKLIDEPDPELDARAPRYTGHEFDAFSGFTYMKGRFQLPSLAKFNRPDPMRDWDWENPSSLNLYQYVRNNPINGWDPTGFEHGMLTKSHENDVELVERYRTEEGTEENLQILGLGLSAMALPAAVLSGTSATAIFLIEEAVGFNPKGVIKGILKSPTVVKNIFGKLKRKRPKPKCFIAGTMVLTENGLTPIELIKPGDEVLTRSEKDGTISYSPVELVTENVTNTLYHVYYLEDGIERELVTTAEHPFWVDEANDWIEAENLRPGQHFVNQNEQPEIVEIIGLKLKRSQGAATKVYNFKVQKNHNYFVMPRGSSTFGSAIWVHNNNCDETSPVSVKGTGLLKFGADDLVYGPSAGGALRDLQQQAGGRLLTDLPKPPSSSWVDFSISTLNKQAQSGGKIRFDLTNVSDLKGVLSNSGSYANTVTAKELRHIQSNWSQFKGATTFYSKGQEVVAPW